MDDTRKTVGQRIKAARRAAGYKSARAFAAAIGISESSIANAERGSSRVGEGVVMDIESALGWPGGSIHRAINTGDMAQLEVSRRDEPDLYSHEIRDSFEREVYELDTLPEQERWRVIVEHRQRHAARQGSSMRRSG